VHGVRDIVLLDTKALNDWFREDVSRRNTLLIVCSGLLDTMMLVAFYRFVRYATTYNVDGNDRILYSKSHCLTLMVCRISRRL
jgi:hypothetical protein